MIRLYFCIILFSFEVAAQENGYLSVASTLQECYENGYLLEKDNRLPHTLNTLIALIEKIENIEDLNLDTRSLSVSILHRFRQDGIEHIPSILKKSHILPYMVGQQGEKYLKILHFISENSNTLLYNVLPDIERCTLHFMLSSSIEMYERGDESTVCRFADNAYRNARSVNSNHSGHSDHDIYDDVETLTSEEIHVIKSHKSGEPEDAIDPNALYPELPPNHPETARVTAPTLSRCPVENGVIKTKWGPVFAGAVIAGIAAGLQPQTIKLSEIFRNESPERRLRSNLSELSVNNKWFATVAGDLAEVTLIQGPRHEKVMVGVNGNWNSSTLPRWYFLKSNENLQFTTAEIRGDIDGLILANEIESLYTNVPTLRLSQILNMYYSAQGLFNSSIRACNRETLFKTVAPRSTMNEQAFSASLVLKEYYRTATMQDDIIENFAIKATDELSTYVSSSMNKDLSCHDTNSGNFNDVIQVAVNLTIIVDTTWPFYLIQPIIANILDNMKINRHASQYTILNGRDGSIMINTTNSILDFAHYNVTNYRNVSASGFDFAKTLHVLWKLQTEKLNNERHSLGNAKSDVLLLIPYTSSVPEADNNFCMNQLKQMREQMPDAKLFILSYGVKDRWANFVIDPSTDLFSTGMSDIPNTSIFNLVSNMKQVPQRMINTKCGADYSAVGSTNSFIDYIQPSMTISYRLHPNYFFSRDSDYAATIKIEGSGWGDLKVCTARQFINVNSADASVSCTSINNNVHPISFSCADAEYIHLCPPLYLSITANSSIRNYQCTDTKVCRFPHMIKYTISYENLVCVSSANINMLNAVVLITSMVYIFL